GVASLLNRMSECSWLPFVVRDRRQRDRRGHGRPWRLSVGVLATGNRLRTLRGSAAATRRPDRRRSHEWDAILDPFAEVREIALVGVEPDDIATAIRVLRKATEQVETDTFGTS
ncbi:MAG TPA: hypothetical protein VN108_02520, partial [Marmoricola sp.]|nr:hypothetical protein [Marmoricola sp.]